MAVMVFRSLVAMFTRIRSQRRFVFWHGIQTPENMQSQKGVIGRYWKCFGLSFVIALLFVFPDSVFVFRTNYDLAACSDLACWC